MALGFNPGGAVALASVLYLLLSIVMGLVERYLRPPLWLTTAVFVPATLVVVWLGTRFSTLLVLDGRTWGVLILFYCVAASLVPVWALLQPRGYLGGFVLYMALAVGVLGVFFGGFPIQQEAFKTWRAPGASGALFPFLFVTIACGACSGFHGLVCSGTTSKQISRESHCRPVGYGAMLLEGFVALIALATVMIATNAELAGKAPGAIYGAGLGRFLAVLIGEQHLLFAITSGPWPSRPSCSTPWTCPRAWGVHPSGAPGLAGAAGASRTAMTALVPLVILLAAARRVPMMLVLFAPRTSSCRAVAARDLGLAAPQRSRSAFVWIPWPSSWWSP